MGRPPTTLPLCQEIHQTLSNSGAQPGDTWERQAWRRLIMVSRGVALQQEADITKTGEVLGYWRRHRSPSSREDRIELLPHPTQFSLDDVEELAIPA